jgi:hypothetical protein
MQILNLELWGEFNEIHNRNIYDFEKFDYHLKNNLSLSESVFRIGSESWFQMINEARELWENNVLDFGEDDLFFLQSDLGRRDFFEGVEVWLDVPFLEEDLYEAEYKGRKVNLNRPFRTSGGPRKFGVYTKNESGKVVLVRFGQPGMRVRNDDPKRSKSFRARHNCDNPGPKWKPRYWSCNVARYRKLLGIKSSSPW